MYRAASREGVGVYRDLVRLLAEDLVVVLLAGNGRMTIRRNRLDLALAGAMLADLVGLRRIGLSGADGVAPPDTKPGRVTVVDAADTGDELLDSVVARIAARPPARPVTLVPRIDGGLRKAVLDRLVAESALRHERRKVLRLFNADRWFVVDKARPAEVDTRLHEALVVGLTADAHTSALIGLLQAVGQTRRFTAGDDRKAAPARAREFAARSWVAGAVHRAIMSSESE